MTYRIVCTNQEPINEPTTHAHIVTVGVGDAPDNAARRLSLSQVLSAIDNGDSFYTVGSRTGTTAKVVSVNCDNCGRRIIKSSPDATTDNNLDSLRACRWSAK